MAAFGFPLHLRWRHTEDRTISVASQCIFFFSWKTSNPLREAVSTPSHPSSHTYVIFSLCFRPYYAQNAPNASQLHFISIFIIANISLKNINVPDWVSVRLQRHAVLDKFENHSIWKMNGAFRPSLGLVSDERAVRDLQHPHRGGHGGRRFAWLKTRK